MSRSLKNMSGRRFGRLKVLDRGGSARDKSATWRCRCSCGNTKEVRGDCLRSGDTQSCGCLQKEKARQANMKHGFGNHRLADVWHGIKKRCYNPNDSHYSYYGGRGIRICRERRSSSGPFVQWALKNGWRIGLQIDWIDVDGNYTPRNCRFVTPRVNSSNTRIQRGRGLPVGAYKRRNRYQAVITLGAFSSPLEAESVREKALKKLNLK